MQKIIKVCSPANATLGSFFILAAVWISRLIQMPKPCVMDLIPLVFFSVIAVISTMNIDVYCVAKHETFAWFMAGLTIVAFAHLMWVVHPDTMLKMGEKKAEEKKAEEKTQ